MAASSSRRSGHQRRLGEAGLVLTARDLTVLQSLWELRCLTREQIQRLHFGAPAGQPSSRAPSVCLRRLGLLRTHGYLTARRMPAAQTAGAAPFVYSLGARSAPLVAQQLGCDAETVRRRLRRDAALSWLFAAHRQAVTDVHIAFRLGQQAGGYRLRWQSEEQLATLDEQVSIGAHLLPIRPDGFFTLAFPDRAARAAFFLEVQLASGPAVFRRKAAAYMAYWGSGAYTARFGEHSLRILAVTDTDCRALNLITAAARSGGATLFWATSLAALTADVLGPNWLVAGARGRFSLLDSQQRVEQAVGVLDGPQSESVAPGLGTGSPNHALHQGLNQPGSVTAPVDRPSTPLLDT